jgi:hypothetical protein
MAMPCFDGLLENEEYDAQVQDLLYVLAYFHALIKLWMDTTTTVGLVRKSVTVLGTELHRFRAGMYIEVKTKEIPRERAARV